MPPTPICSEELRYVMDANGTAYTEKTIKTLLVDNFRDRLLAQANAGFAVLSPALIPLPCGDLRFVIPMSGNITMAIVELKYFNFHTLWNIDSSSGLLLPTLNNGALINPEAGQRELLWYIPKDVWRVFWAVDLNTYNTALASYRILNPKKDGTITYVRRGLPLPNMWTDTRLCWKPDSELRNSILRKTVAEKATALIAGWTNSTWNTDLNKEGFKHAFRFRVDGTQLPPGLDWASLEHIPTNIPAENLAMLQTIEAALAVESGKPVLM